MKKTKIPKKIADNLMFLSDWKCCICGSEGHQIHHIDGNANNNSLDNLVLLCFDHHSEAEKRGGLGRNLTPGVIRKYRDLHFERVKTSRKFDGDVSKRKNHGINKEEYFQLISDAILATDIFREQERLTTKWQNMEILLSKMNVNPYRIGYFAKKAILQTLYDITNRTRYGLPEEYAYMIESIAMNMTPAFSYDRKRTTPLSDEDITLLHYCSLIGSALAYDGALRLKSIHLTKTGSFLLSHSLRIASINKCESLTTLILEEYKTAEDGTKRSGIDDLYQLILFEKNAASSAKHFPPKYPKRLLRVFGIQQQPSK